MNKPIYIPTNTPTIQIIVKRVEETPAPLCKFCLGRDTSTPSEYGLDFYMDRPAYNPDERATEKERWQPIFQGLKEELITTGPILHDTIHVCMVCALGLTTQLDVESPLTVLPDHHMICVLFGRWNNPEPSRYIIVSKDTSIAEIVRRLFRQDPVQDLILHPTPEQ